MAAASRGGRWESHMRKTKIICTLGPASDGEGILEQLMLSGMDCARFNFSHGTHADHKARMDRVKSLRKKHGLHTAIMLDTKGPEIRLGKFQGGEAVLQKGQEFTFRASSGPGDATRVQISFPRLAENVAPGARILVDDGKVAFTVTAVRGTDVVCQALNGGRLTDRKSINLPNSDIDMPYISEADRSDLLFGISQDVDFVAASFVRRAQDVHDLRALLRENGGGSIRIISKIENMRGIENLEEIIEASDGVMVARGDLGVETPFEEIPAIQKRVIDRCYRRGKQVVTATQMLESMVSNPRPTRAEVSDVANAVYDGTTAIMLSGESASGLYPVESLRAMADIACATERSIDYRHRYIVNKLDINDDIPNAVCNCACLASFTLDVAAVIAVTRTGRTARDLSNHRPLCPIIAPCMDEKSCRQLSLAWGVYPILAEEQFNTDKLLAHAVERAKETGLAKSGDLVVMASAAIGQKRTDLMRIQYI